VCSPESAGGATAGGEAPRFGDAGVEVLVGGAALRDGAVPWAAGRIG
jgi:hypothetical protein